MQPRGQGFATKRECSDASTHRHGLLPRLTAQSSQQAIAQAEQQEEGD
jgi:hypothetical protein